MKKLNVLLAITPIILSIGCGKDFSGTYKGRETIQGSSVVNNGDPSASVTMTINQDGDRLSGTWESSNSSGTITGTVNGDTANIDLNATAKMMTQNQNTGNQNQNGGIPNNTFQSTQPCAGGQFKGPLSLSSNEKTLSGTMASQGNNNNSMYGASSGCTGYVSRTINVSK